MHQSCKNERRYLYHKNDTRLQNTFPFEEKFDKYAGSNSPLGLQRIHIDFEWLQVKIWDFA